MHSIVSRAACAALMLTLLMAPAHRADAAADEPQVSAALATVTSTSNAEIRRAIAELRTDPALSPTHLDRVLRWLGTSEPQDTPRERTLPWLRRALGWLSSSTRVLMWIVLGIAAIAVMIGLVRLFRDSSLPAVADRLVIPSHVSHLDIRPESLPADVGAAARALWDRGESRAALSLLYRGLLSRLVHSHAIPIRESSTEGECVALTTQRLRGGPVTYVSRLVGVWQAAVYGAQVPATLEVHELCAQFAPTLDAPVLDARP